MHVSALTILAAPWGRLDAMLLAGKQSTGTEERYPECTRWTLSHLACMGNFHGLKLP